MNRDDAPEPTVRMPDRVLVLRLLHPVPTVLNALLVASMALVSGAGTPVAAFLALAMLAFQVSIGALDDIVDAEVDRHAGRAKPIPLGLVSRRTAWLVVVVGATAGLAISAWFGLAVFLLGALGLGSGLAYDYPMRQRGLGWACFVVAFPTLLAWVWLAAAGTLPEGWPLLMPLAAIAGPTVHLANGLVDVELDAAGRPGLATRLGVERARLLLMGMTGLVYLLAWLLLISQGGLPLGTQATALVASLLSGIGLTGSWRPSRTARLIGWQLQAVGLALLAVAWALAVT